MPQQEKQIDLQLGVPLPSWQHRHGAIDGMLLAEAVLSALEKALRETTHSVQPVQINSDLSEQTGGQRRRFTLPKPLQVLRTESTQTPRQFIHTLLATLQALPWADQQPFMTALEPLLPVLLQAGFPLSAQETVPVAQVASKEQLAPSTGFEFRIDGEPIPFAEKDTKLSYLLQFLLLQTQNTSFHELTEFLLSLERTYGDTETRKKFVDSLEIITLLKQLQAVLRANPSTSDCVLHIEPNTKRVSVSFMPQKKIAVTYYLGYLTEVVQLDEQTQKQRIRPIVGSCGLQRYMAEPQQQFIVGLQDLAAATTESGQVYPEGWIPQEVMCDYLVRELPQLVADAQPGGYTLSRLYTMVQRSLGPLKGMVERRSLKPSDHQLPITYYRLNPRIVQADPPQTALLPLDLEVSP